MKGNLTPHKELLSSAEPAVRRVKEAPSKSASDQVKKPQKITKKCLNSAFAAIPEDQSPRKSASIDSNFASVNSTADQHEQLLEIFDRSMDPVLSLLPEPFEPFIVSPSTTIVEDNQETSSGVVDYNESVDCDIPKTGNIDVGIAVDFIREAFLQASSSTDINLRSKKILDCVVKIVIDDLYGLPEERARSPEVEHTKLRIGFLCSFLWLVPVMVVAFALSNFLAGSPFPESPPT